MKRLQYTRQVNLGRLNDQLLAQIPALAPVPGPGGFPTAVFTLEGDATKAIVTVPDAVDQATVDAVVAAHDGTPTVPPPAPDYGSEMVDVTQNAAAAVQQMRDFINTASPTNAQVVANLKLLNRLGLWLVKSRIG